MKLNAYPGLGEIIPGRDSAGSSQTVHNLGGCRSFDSYNLAATSSDKPILTGRKNAAILLRNSTGGVVYPKRFYALRDDANGTYDLCEEVDAIAATANQRNVIQADPWLPSTGVPSLDCFWGMIDGPTKFYTPQAAANFLGGAIAVGDALVVSDDANGRVCRAHMDQDVSLINFRDFDAPQKTLAGVTADDAEVLGGTFGTNSIYLSSMDFQSSNTDEYARTRVQLPLDYVAGAPVQIIARGGMLTTVASVTATIDFAVHRDTATRTVGDDICATAAQSVNSLTFASKTFTITATTLVPGDILDIMLTLEGETATAAVTRTQVDKITLRYGCHATPWSVGTALEVKATSDVSDDLWGIVKHPLYR